MTLVIVPNTLRDAIYEKVDSALVMSPEATPDRVVYFQQLLAHVDEFGTIPNFTITRRTQCLSQQAQ